MPQAATLARKRIAKTGDVAKQFVKYRVRWAGAPRKLQYDRGSEFEGRFAKMLDRLNIDGYVVPVEAAWQNGLVERQGAILESFVASVVQEVAAEF